MGRHVPYLGESGSNLGYATSRFVEHASQRFPAAILQTPLPFSPTSDVLPPSWGPQTRSTSIPSPPLASPLVSSPYSRRDSTYSVGVQGVSSPGASSNSSRGDDGRPRQYTATRGQGQSLAAYIASTPALAPQQYGTNTPTYVAPLLSAHDPSSADTNGNNGAQYLHANQSYVGRHRSAPQAAAQSGTQTSLPNSEHHASYFIDMVVRPLQQEVGYADYSQPQSSRGHHGFSPAAGAWTRYLHDNSTAPVAAARPRLAVPTLAPAAPLQNILHPVDRTPLLRHAEVPNLSGNEIQVASDGVLVASGSNGRRNERRQRSSFTLDQRNETSQTRALGACLRCKSQRVRVC